MLAFTRLPDPVLHALTTRALTELRRVVITPLKSWSALDWSNWDEALMGLRLIYTDSAIEQASAILLGAHKDPATLWDLDSHHWLHLLIALDVIAQAHEPFTHLGPSQVERLDFRSLQRCIPRRKLRRPADIPGELVWSERETGELTIHEEVPFGPDSLSITSLGPPPAVYIEALRLPMPAIIEFYPIPITAPQKPR